MSIASRTGFSIDGRAFSKGLAMLGRVIPRRSPHPAGKCLRIERRSDGGIWATATDCEIAIQTLLDDEGEWPIGLAVLVPFAELVAAVKQCPKGERVTVEYDHDIQAVAVSSGPTTTEIPLVDISHAWSGKLPGSPADSFAADLSEQWYAGVAAAVPHTDSENSRYALGAVLLERDATEWVAVACDGRRLVALPIGPGTFPLSLLIMAKHCEVLAACHKATGRDGMLWTGENDWRVEMGNTIVGGRLVEGRFPKWRDVLPDNRNNAGGFTIDEPLLVALRGMVKLATDDHRAVEFASNGDGLLVVEYRWEGRVAVYQHHAGVSGPINVSLDPRYVVEVAESVGMPCYCRTRQIACERGIVASGPATISGNRGRGVIMPMAKK